MNAIAWLLVAMAVLSIFGALKTIGSVGKVVRKDTTPSYAVITVIVTAGYVAVFLSAASMLWAVSA